MKAEAGGAEVALEAADGEGEGGGGRRRHALVAEGAEADEELLVRDDEARVADDALEDHACMSTIPGKG